MKLLPPEPTVDIYNGGFAEPDLMQRKAVSAALSNLLDRIEDPLVIALDGGWGTGKTHFLQRWVGAHTIENASNATTVYFDAFAHDYISDPLPAILSAISERLPKDRKNQIEKAKDAAWKIAKPLARIGISAATFGATEALGDLGDAVAKAISSEAKLGIDAYWKGEDTRREAMDDLKAAMKSLAAPNNAEQTGSSLVIVVDELDRCRPDYALEVLEVIKHFFAVPHIHFVLGVNLSALENSVRVRYGESCDAHAYLKKFIQVILELPNQIGDRHQQSSVVSIYLRHLIKEMNVPKHIGHRLQSQLELVAKYNDVSLRDVGKIVSLVNLSSVDVLENGNILPGWIDIMNDLIIARIVQPDLHNKMLDSTIESAELANFFGASDDVILEKINGRRNPKYDPLVWWRYHSWLYIINDGQLGEDIPQQGTKSIASSFDTFGSFDEPKTIPKEVHSRYLDHFRIQSA